MRIGVYIDGYNLYYGGRKQLGKVPGWRWLDLRALADTLVGEQRSWNGASVDRIVYCTARIDQGLNPVGHIEQDVYLKALLATGSVDHIEYGKYVKGIRKRPLAVLGSCARAERPLIVQCRTGRSWCSRHSVLRCTDASFMVSTLHQEEKGTDVNVATHLLIDVSRAVDVDAVVVVSNDSDLKLPVRIPPAGSVPVGHVNPLRQVASPGTSPAARRTVPAGIGGVDSGTAGLPVGISYGDPSRASTGGPSGW